MKPFFAVTLVATFAPGLHAGPTENAIVAAMKLSERPNYSWSTTIADDARTYEVEGKTDQSGFTWMRMPMVKVIAERLGRDADPQIEAIFRGSGAYVIRTDRGWKTFKELPKKSWDWNDNLDFWPPPSARANLSAAALAGLDPLDVSPFPPSIVMLPPPPLPEEDEPRPYSNLQFALCLPHDELSVIVSSFTSLKVEGDTVTGALSDIGAQLLLVREGQDHIKPLLAGGLFKLSVRNGFVTRYQLRLEGILLVDRKKILVHQESSTHITSVGTTAVRVIDDVRRKLRP